MDFSKMSVDEIITYLFTEAEKGRVFSIDELDKAVEACSIIDRTANADAAVSLALEQLETNASGYSKHIILLSDGDVNVAQANLNKAIENNVKIHTIGLGSGANNSVLKHYAEETGGDFFATTTAAELATIYKYLSLENHFDLVNMPDDDADGLPDEFEVSGLILSNGQIFYTNPTNGDCDDDGLLDGEEISAEVKFVIKKDNRGGSIEYEAIVFKYNCDPWKIDTDGDLDLDADDLYPTDYQLNGLLINNINKLFMLANMYSYENSLSSNKYETDVEIWLIFMFLRQFNSGYVNSSWSGTGNAIDEDFVDYVAKHNIVLYEYFEGTTTFYANSKGELGDLYHMAATLTGYIFKSGFDYGYAFGIMPEYHIDNLSGWAGDLQTAMNDAMAITDMTKDYDLFKDVMSNLIGYDPNTDDIYNEYQHSFDMDDVYADTDAYNIYVKLCEGESIHNVLLDYYDTGYLKRFSSFTSNANEEAISELVYTYTSNKYMNMIQWPLFDYDFNEVQSEAARDAFVEFLMEKIANE